MRSFSCAAGFNGASSPLKSVSSQVSPLVTMHSPTSARCIA